MRVSEPAYKHLLPPKEAGVKPIAQLQPPTPAASAPLQPSGGVGSIPAPAITAPSGSSSISSLITMAKLSQQIVQVPKAIAQVQLPATTPTPTAVVKDTVSVAQPPFMAPDSLGLLKPPVNSPTVEHSSPPKEQKDIRRQQTLVTASASPAPAKDTILTVLPEGIKMVLPPTIPWAKLMTRTTVASTSHAEAKVTASATPHQATLHSATTTPGEQGGGALVQPVGGASVKQVSGASVQQVGGAAVQQVGGVITQEAGRKPTQPMGQTGSTTAVQARKVHAKPLPITGGAPIRGTATQRQNMTTTQQVIMSSTQQVGVPSTQQMGVPSTQQVGVSSTQQVGVPSTQQVGVPSTQQVGVSSTQQVGVSSTQQMGVSSTQQVGVPSTQQVGVSSMQQVGVPSMQQVAAAQELPSKSSAQLDLILKKIVKMKAFPPTSSDPIVLLSQNRPSPTTALPALQSMPGKQPSSCSTLHTVAGTVESVSMATTVPRSPIATQIMAEHSYQDSSTTLASTAMAGDVTVGAVAMATPTVIRQTTNLCHPPDSNNPSL